MSKRAVMAFSGGLDSTGLLMHLLADDYRVDAISFDYGQKHSLELERATANVAYLKEKNISVSHRVIDLTSAMSTFESALTSSDAEIPEGHYEEEQMRQTVVPNRNAIFSSILYGHALSIVNKEETGVVLALGVHSGDHIIYPDCRPDFYDALGHAFQVGNWDSEHVTFHLPFLNGDKATILKDAEKSTAKLGLDFDTVFANTNTSYNPDEEGRSSGKSGADVERILAFNSIGRPDPVPYAEPWETVLENALAIQKEFREK